MLTLTLRRILLNCISICTGLEKTEFLLEIKAALDPYEVSLAKLSVEAKTVEVHSVRFGDDYTGWRGDGQEDT
jgi:hypothetical protein